MWKQNEYIDCECYSVIFFFLVAVLGGFLYVAGGERTNDHKSPENSVYRYDPRTNTWLPVASMKYKRQSFQLVALNGLLYAIGKYNGLL